MRRPTSQRGIPIWVPSGKLCDFRVRNSRARLVFNGGTPDEEPMRSPEIAHRASGGNAPLGAIPHAPFALTSRRRLNLTLPERGFTLGAARSQTNFGHRRSLCLSPSCLSALGDTQEAYFSLNQAECARPSGAVAVFRKDSLLHVEQYSRSASE